MDRRPNPIVLSLLTLVASVRTAGPLAGGEEDEAERGAQRSIAVLSFRNLETFETRMAYILEHSRGARTARRFTGWVGQFSGVLNRGVARERPLGWILRSDGGLLFFFPVEDRDRARSAFEGVFPDRRALGTSGVYRIEGSGPMYVKMRSRWCYVGLQKDPLVQRLPRPETLLPAEAARYDIFLTVDIETLESLRQRREEPAIANTVPVEAWARQLAEDLPGGGKRLDLGMNLWPRPSGELVLLARPESFLARSSRALLGRSSRFSLPESPGSVLNLRLTLPIALFVRDGLAVQENAGSLPVVDLTGAVQLHRTILNDAWNALKARLEGKVLDLALTVRMRPGGALDFALGAFLPGAASLDRWLRKNLPLLKKLRLVREFELAKRNFEGVSLHEIRAAGLHGSPFGRDPGILVGTGAEVVYVAVGDGGLALVRQLHRGTRKEPAENRGARTGPVYVEVSLGPVLEALGDYVELPFTDQLRALHRSDRFRLRLESDPDVVRVSYEVDEAVLAPLVAWFGRLLDR